MSRPAITVEHLSKSYVLKHQRHRYVALRDIIADRMKSLFSRNHTIHRKELFSALDDVSFEIESGDTVGIIGRNGAGKSTLLKILSRIVSPTAGTVTIDGRVASLLEVGTGFHPELSGRENIFLNGSILGMTRNEIRRRFEEIVAFAEVEQFLDTPVKRYSSGMYVRLAFSVAAHLEPEILIVDEVLAVGDSEFQKKCLGKMRNVSRDEGRTVIFVSHNMQAVQSLCRSGLLLQKGKLVRSGKMEEVVKAYLDSGQTTFSRYDIPHDEAASAEGYAYRLQVEDCNGIPAGEIPVGDPWQVRVCFRLKRKTGSFVVALGIVNAFETPVRTSWSASSELEEGEYEAVFKNDDVHYTTGEYRLAVGLSSGGRAFQYVPDAGRIVISDAGLNLDGGRILNTQSGLVLNPMKVEIRKNSF